MTAQQLVVLLERLGLKQVRLRNNNVSACCPNHTERRPSWGISVASPYLHGCWGCGYRGTLRDMLLSKFGWTWEQTATVLGGPSKPLADIKLWQHASTSAPVIDESNMWPYEMLSKKSLDYLMQERGLKRRVIRLARLGYDRLQKRVVFPFYFEGRLFGMTGRLIEGQGSKIVAYSGLQKRFVPYIPAGNFPGGKLVLVEGEIDSLKVLQAGFNVAAFTQGSISKEQVNFINRLNPSELIFFFDHDEAGQRLTETAIRLWRRRPTSTVQWPKHVTTKLDPAMLTTADCQRLVNTAKPNKMWAVKFS